MKIAIVWEMSDTETAREFIGSVREMPFGTIARLPRWVEEDIKKHEQSATVLLDQVCLYEMGECKDSEGEPMQSKFGGFYDPSNDVWEWSDDAKAVA